MMVDTWRGRRFESLTDAEVVALAINNEDDAAKTYGRFAEALQVEYPGSARLFREMAAEEEEHSERLRVLFKAHYGDAIPVMTASGVRGIPQERLSSLSAPRGVAAMRRRARQMEENATRFYHQAASRVADPEVRRVFADLAAAEAAHGETAGELDPDAPPTAERTEELASERKQFILRIIQPGLVGLMDGSVSTLAPVFAAAFATHDSWKAFLVGLAASLGAGISMGFAEALADDGRLSGRGAPLLRGVICGAMTVAGGIGHTLPYLIHDFVTATVLAGVVALLELLVIAWVQWRYMDTRPLAAAAKVMLGGAVVLAVGIWIGSR